jgi:serine/threonine protein kinase
LFGEGGMGVVYMAEQEHPVRRRVALKIIKPGMDSGQVIARFEAERQALAMMDHPNIAKVLDAGTIEAHGPPSVGVGRPYFVMELVKGVPITKFCDENHLTPRERLELFLPVCQAVQHAHTKGIIHRDLKPSNVLVALYDDQPVPKVIDFGVAKATGEKLTERTMFTAFGSFVGTLEYMSPEQAKLNALDIDTRSDIYALGILLYELLTGSTPLEKARLKESALDELLRLIREEEPPKPSTRLSRSGEALATISSRRRTEPAKLGKVLRGELDWIVMKALEKDRTRRYETASGLARDLQRTWPTSRLRPARHRLATGCASWHAGTRSRWRGRPRSPCCCLSGPWSAPGRRRGRCKPSAKPVKNATARSTRKDMPAPKNRMRRPRCISSSPMCWNRPIRTVNQIETSKSGPCWTARPAGWRRIGGCLLSSRPPSAKVLGEFTAAWGSLVWPRPNWSRRTGCSNNTPSRTAPARWTLPFN